MNVIELLFAIFLEIVKKPCFWLSVTITLFFIIIDFIIFLKYKTSLLYKAIH